VQGQFRLKSFDACTASLMMLLHVAGGKQLAMMLR
jgi:hypothetical protein